MSNTVHKRLSATVENFVLFVQASKRQSQVSEHEAFLKILSGAHHFGVSHLLHIM